MDKFKKYLPSKQFISIILIIVIFIALFFAIKGLVFLLKKNKIIKGENSMTEVTVGGIIQKDSNANGIPDWEEYLWGLNPKKDGESNKEFILSKKRELSQSGVISTTDDSISVTENELLSREFFATIVSLQQTGNLNEESIKSVANAIGQKIEATDIPDVYTKNMLAIKQDSEDSKATYSGDFVILALQYQDKDIGKELTLISQGIGNNDPQALYAAKSIASAYKSFGKDLMKIPVPNSAADLHLSLANNYEKTGQSIDGLTEVLTDPIIGMKSMLNYKKYNDALISNIETLTEVLK